jgi:hypothetical protein
MRIMEKGKLKKDLPPEEPKEKKEVDPLALLSKQYA